MCAGLWYAHIFAQEQKEKDEEYPINMRALINPSLNQFFLPITSTKIIRITFSYGKIQVGGIAYTTYVNAVFILNRIHK